MPSKYRVQLFVNGYQFGKYVSHIGPQSEFYVPEGVLNYRGENAVGLTLWAMEDRGAAIEGFALNAGRPIRTASEEVRPIQQPRWKRRHGAY